MDTKSPMPVPVGDEYASTNVIKKQQQQQQQPKEEPILNNNNNNTRAPVRQVTSTVSAPAPVMPDTRHMNPNHMYTLQQQQRQYSQSASPQPIYVKREERTVASLLGDRGADDDDDDEIGLDELDDEYLNAADSPSPPPSDFHRHNSMTRKQAHSFVLPRSSGVSLAQLPPPLENCLVESDLEVLANASPAMKQLQAQQQMQQQQQQHYHVHSRNAHSQGVAVHGHYTNRQHNNPIQIQFHAAGGSGMVGVGGMVTPNRVGGGGGQAVVGSMPQTSPSTEHLVLAPPPQFSDGVEEDGDGDGAEPVPVGMMHHGHNHYHGQQQQQMQQMHHHQMQQQQKLGPNVRIVGAVPKSTNRF